MEKVRDCLLEKDAAPISAHITEIVEYSDESGIVELPENINRRASNNMVLSNQTNSQAVFKFENCKGITLGSVFNMGWGQGNNGVIAEPNISNQVRTRESIYKKTPTIKEMLESTEPISTTFLDIVAGNFGLRWKEVTILLQINQLKVDRKYADFFERGGTKEVLFQILSEYLKEHEEMSTVGQLIKLLWTNGFRETVWSIKEFWKTYKQLEKDLQA